MTTLGVLVGNRGFFPGRALRAGKKGRPFGPQGGRAGSGGAGPERHEVRIRGNPADAKKCAELFKANREKIDGILVTLPNFGDERGIADAIKHVGAGRPGARPRIPR